MTATLFIKTPDLVDQITMQAATPIPAVQHRAPVPLERIEKLGYIAHEHDLHEVAARLKRHGYRGAICGPAGGGKSVMLQAIGDELMAHGLTPLPLMLEPDRASTLPLDWRRTIRRARHTDALLLDGYDLLPAWAKAWVWCASMRAGAVVVTKQKEARFKRFKTMARLRPTVTLMRQLVDQLHPNASNSLDCETIYARCNGNLREALILACQQLAPVNTRPVSDQKHTV